MTSSVHRVFARHAHPVSAWSRWASTPLLVVPLWTRRSWTWIPIAAWMVLNPVVTPPASDDHAFTTRAILGEERWVADPTPRPDIIALNAARTALLAAAGAAAWRRRPLATAGAIAGAMAVILMTWRRYAELYDAGSAST